MIAITDNPKSTLSLVANVMIVRAHVSRADPIGLAPTASAAAATRHRRRDGARRCPAPRLRLADFEHHPGGALGKLMESVYKRAIEGG